MIKKGMIWFISILFCSVFWFLVFYSFIAHAQPAPTPVNNGGAVSDDAYGNDWDGDTVTGASRNALFDKIETIDSTSINAGVLFNVKSYGAKGDGIHFFDGNISSGSSIFSSSSASFTSEDIGKVITILNAGGTKIDKTATISSVTDAHTVVLSSNASATVSNASFTYGTDDTAAIQSAIDATQTTTNNFGSVFFPAGIYIVNGTFTKSNNSQLELPVISRVGSVDGPIGTVVMEGALTSTQQTAGDYVADGGSVIYSTRNGTDGTNSILSAKTPTEVSAGYSFTQIKLLLKNLTFRTVQNPKNSALNLEWILQVFGEYLLVDVAGMNNIDITEPTYADSYAVRMPRVLNGASTFLYQLKTRGFYNGVLLEEHGTIEDSLMFYHINGIVFSGNGVDHPKFVKNTTIERVKNPIKFIDGISYVNVEVSIEDTAGGSGDWSGLTVHVSDINNYGRGFIWYSVVNDPNFTLSGGKYLSLITPYTSRTLLRSDGVWPLRIQNSGNAPGDSSGPEFTLISNSGAVQTSGSRLGEIQFRGALNTTNTLSSGAIIKSFTTQNWGASSGGANISLWTTPNNSITALERFRIDSTGNVGVGTINPSKELHVLGNARITGLISCDTIDTDANGNLSCGSDNGTGTGNVTINTTSPLTGGATGSTFNLGLDQSLLTLSSIGGAVTDAQVPNNITITGLSGTNTGDQDISGKQNISSLETDVEALVDLQDLQGAVTDAQVPNTITIDNATTAANLGADGVNALTEVDQAIKTAANDTSKLVVGTAGSTDDCAKWDANGNLVSAGGACGTSSGAPVDADYLVGTANGGLSAEIVVGTSPGGELGGTWGSPTIDDSVTVTGWDLGASIATTPAEDDNDTSVATTAYVQMEISGLGGSTGWTDGGTNIYTTTTTDKVGIGTTTPYSDTKLTVKGGASTGTDDFIALFAQNGVTPEVTSVAGVAYKGVWTQGDGGAYYGARDVTNDIELLFGTSSLGAGFLGSVSSHPMQLRSNNTTYVTVMPTGNVGIGTTAPVGQLNVGTSYARIGTGGTNSNALAAGELYVQGDLEVDGTMYGNISGNAATVTTNANLSGEVTSSGNTTTIADSVTVTGWALGASTATTPAGGDNDTSLATTAYVQTEIAGLGSGGWTDGGTTVYPTTTTDNVGIGTFTPVSGAILTIKGTIAGADAGQPFAITDANVGIGTILPRSILEIQKGSGTAQITIDGTSGGCLMFQDTDGAGWTECDALNGTLSCSTDADGVCD